MAVQAAKRRQIRNILSYPIQLSAEISQSGDDLVCTYRQATLNQGNAFQNRAEGTFAKHGGNHLGRAVNRPHHHSKRLHVGSRPRAHWCHRSWERRSKWGAAAVIAAQAGAHGDAVKKQQDQFASMDTCGGSCTRLPEEGGSSPMAWQGRQRLRVSSCSRRSRRRRLSI